MFSTNYVGNFLAKKLVDYNTIMAKKKNVAMVVKWYFILKTIRRHTGNGHH